MVSRVCVAAAVVLSCALAACVGDDTLAPGQSPGVQGGSGPPPSSYDATVDGAGSPDAAGDAPGDATRDGGDASIRSDGGDAGDAGSAVDASDASDGAGDAGSTDAADASDA